MLYEVEVISSNPPFPLLCRHVKKKIIRMNKINFFIYIIVVDLKPAKMISSTYTSAIIITTSIWKMHKDLFDLEQMKATPTTKNSNCDTKPMELFYKPKFATG
jgi:hypothetical protein